MKKELIDSYHAFWAWFQKNERSFFKAVEERKAIEKAFFRKLSPKLNKVKEGIYFLAGMDDVNTAELILTADGNVKNIAFVEELVAAAPAMAGWKFTALKPASDISKTSIEMSDYEFNTDTISFYATEDPAYPDEINITVVHTELTEENKPTVGNGVYIFLDSYLGEMEFVTSIDNLTIIGPNDAQEPLVAIEKLTPYLTWRQKEFTERYESVRHDTENDNYASLEATLSSGKPLFAIVDTDLLEWDAKVSHPWLLVIEITYEGNDNGLPDTKTSDLLNAIEDEISAELLDFEGYLNVGRQTADNIREIYFACKDFRKPSITMHLMQKKYLKNMVISFDIYKDKYWQSFERFNRT